MSPLGYAITAILPRGSPQWKALRWLKHGIYTTPSHMKLAYRNLMRSSIFEEPWQMDMCSLFPEKTLMLVMNRLAPRSVLDIGCGTGKSLDFFLERGLDAVGLEGSRLAIKKSRCASRIIQCDLNKEQNLGRTFDLAWSFEVVEHIHPRYVDNLVKTFANHSGRIVMSAARPGQGGEGHFNEQPPQYWIAKFEAVGFRLDVPLTEELRSADEMFSKNMMAFAR